MLTEKSIEQLREGVAALHVEKLVPGDACEAIECLGYQGAVSAWVTAGELIIRGHDGCISRSWRSIDEGSRTARIHRA